MVDKSRHYVDKEELYEHMKAYHKECLEAEAQGLPTPKANDYIGKAIVDIATHMSYKYNFIRYPFRDEMIGDGIVAAVKAAPKFDPTVSENAFGFFSQTIWWIFLQRIEAEKKKLYVKHKLIEQAIVMSELHETDEHSSDEGGATYNLESEFMNDFVRSYEEKIERKKKERREKKKKANG